MFITICIIIFVVVYAVSFWLWGIVLHLWGIRR